MPGMEGHGMILSNQKQYDSVERLTAGFLHELQEDFDAHLSEHERVSLFLGGGRTPVPIYQTFDQLQVDWSRIDIWLTDERWVAFDQPERNELMLMRTLPQCARSSVYHSELTSSRARHEVIEKLNQDLNMAGSPCIAVLGMGLDGHIASLFPPVSLDLSFEPQTFGAFQICRRHQDPFLRWSLSWEFLLAIPRLYLLMVGEEKWQAWQSWNEADPLPVLQLAKARPDLRLRFSRQGFAGNRVTKEV